MSEKTISEIIEEEKKRVYGEMVKESCVMAGVVNVSQSGDPALQCGFNLIEQQDEDGEYSFLVIFEYKGTESRKTFKKFGKAMKWIYTRGNRMLDEEMLPWSKLFPEGRHIYYEGNDPVGFRAQIMKEFGFDPGTSEGWGRWVETDREPEGGFYSYSFYCPVEHLDAIYGNDRFPMGS